MLIAMNEDNSRPELRAQIAKPAQIGNLKSTIRQVPDSRLGRSEGAGKA